MKFEYHPRVLEQLGTELITSNEIAIAELVKNSYDANAKKTQIHFLTSIHELNKEKHLYPISNELFDDVTKVAGKSPLIIIEDDGDGMDYEVLKKAFFTVGSTYKKDELKKKQNKRIILGDKGLGRLASQRLAPVLFVETKGKKEKEGTFVKVDWIEIIKNKNLESPEKKIKDESKDTYTRLWMVGNWEYVSEGQTTKFPIKIEDYIRQGNPQQELYAENAGEIFLTEALQTNLSYLFTPFEKKISDFQIKAFYNNKKINTKFNNEAENIAEIIHYFKIESNKESSFHASMEIRPWYLERIHENLCDGNFQQFQLKHSGYKNLIKKYKQRFDSSLAVNYDLNVFLEKYKKTFSSESLEILTKISPIESKVFSFKRDQKLLRLAIDSALDNGFLKKQFTTTAMKPFLDIHNGIRLYRGGHRIATLGDKESDWLKLQQSRTRGQQFFRFELGNNLGYIKITDPEQNFIQEVSSRTELKENDFSKELMKLLNIIFNELFYHFTRSAYYISRDIFDEEKLIPKVTNVEIENKIDEAEKLIQKTKKALKNFKESVKILAINRELNDDNKVNSVKSAIDKIINDSRNIDDSINNTISTAATAKETLNSAKIKYKEIELESYNNYKLMANGLITEVITHELHDLLGKQKTDVMFNDYLNEIKEFLVNNNARKLMVNNLKPIEIRVNQLTEKVDSLNKFYQFIEKTFLYKGNFDDLVKENVFEFLSEFKEKINPRLSKHKIHFSFDKFDVDWLAPRGTLIHVFYNLFTNSNSWIKYRRNKAKRDKFFMSTETDYIKIELKDDNTIWHYDSGTGVLPQLNNTLFHPLVSGKNNGRGMGLYIIKKLLESFGASIHLRDEANKYGYKYIFEIKLQNELLNL